MQDRTNSLSSRAKLRNFAATKKPRLKAEAVAANLSPAIVTGRRFSDAVSPETRAAPLGARRLKSQALLRFDHLGLNHHKFPHRSFVEELDSSRDLGEKRVVFAASHVETGLHPRAALPDDNRPARHQLSAESLKPKPLRVRIAPVS